MGSLPRWFEIVLEGAWIMALVLVTSWLIQRFTRRGEEMPASRRTPGWLVVTALVVLVVVMAAGIIAS